MAGVLIKKEENCGANTLSHNFMGCVMARYLSADSLASSPAWALDETVTYSKTLHTSYLRAFSLERRRVRLIAEYEVCCSHTEGRPVLSHYETLVSSHSQSRHDMVKCDYYENHLHVSHQNFVSASFLPHFCYN
jgi:hypothetical protein